MFFTINLNPMASIEEKVNCVLWLAELKSTVAVQRKFRIEYNKEPPHRNTIAKWMKKFKETGSVHDKPRSGRPCVSDESVASIENSFKASPRNKQNFNKTLQNIDLLLSNPFYRLFLLYTKIKL